MPQYMEHATVVRTAVHTKLVLIYSCSRAYIEYKFTVDITLHTVYCNESAQHTNMQQESIIKLKITVSVSRLAIQLYAQDSPHHHQAR